MKKRIFIFLYAFIMISLSASSQSIKENIDKAAKDKSNAERAAKADVLIQKKIIYDSATQIKITPTKVVTKTPAVTKAKYKKRKYKRKSKTSSK